MLDPGNECALRPRRPDEQRSRVDGNRAMAGPCLEASGLAGWLSGLHCFLILRHGCRLPLLDHRDPATTDL